MNQASISVMLTTVEDVLAFMQADRQAVDRLITQRLASDVLLVNQVSQHIISGGGKRLRPLVHLLCARAAGYSGTDHHKLAAIIEFIHTSTLLHDDVVDESAKRRGKVAAHRLWGNAASVLVGDFLYSRSFQLMVELDRMSIMRILADTTNTIAEGEVLQLMQIGNADLSVDDYFQVISDKTACLFAASARLGGVLGGLDEAACQQLDNYGLWLGQAFQIVDDVLDYRGTSDDLGKNAGDDLAEGKVTLPLILALQSASDEERAMMRSMIEEGGSQQIERIRSIMLREQVYERALAQAHTLAERARGALAGLPEGPEREALAILAEHAIERAS